jgi:putative nucleotidyltransferase with HDIG domain
MPTDSGNKDKGTRGALAVISDRLLDALEERFAASRYERRNRLILLLATILLLTFLIVPNQQFLAVSYKAGEIATSDIRATQDYLLEDRPLTEKKRSQAEAAAPSVYSFNAIAALDVTQRFEKVLNLVREAKAGGEFDRLALRDAVAKVLGCEVSGPEFDSLLRLRGERAFLDEISRLTARIYSQKIVADKKAFAIDRAHGILVVDPETKREIAAGDYSTHIDVTEAVSSLAKMRIAAGGEPRDLLKLKGLLARTILPNLAFDRAATEEKRREARESVRPVLFQVKRGEMIVRIGERISEEQALKLAKIFEARQGTNWLFMGLGICGLVLVLFYFPYRFARKNIRKFNPSNKDLFLLAFLTLGTFSILKMASAVSAAMGGLFPYIDTADYTYLLPFAVGPTLVRIILNSEVALVYCAICAPLLGIMFNNSLPVVIYALLGGIVGAHGVRHCKDRGTIYTAGLKVSVVNLAMALSFQIFSDSLFTMQTLYCAIFALAGGIINAIVVSGTVPLIESLFQYTTDIKLLELSNLNSPILRELMIKAPGTYHHSVLVGNLVEAAAEAINANPLLARVAAYYHDIGKVSKPLYFIENLSNGENRHDKLSPSMSALVLISHVKEGAELARENRLGRSIVEIIRQSHGTGLITFFYDKAKKTVAEGVVVDERDFRYPGPKPQTREAGLVLLADHVEAASRTLADPTPSRIQGMVQKIINNIFIDGQLDECELTLKNLHEIAKSFNGILAGIYHHRIDYPEPAYKERGSGGKKDLESSDSEPAAESAGRDEKAKKGGGEDLKRLGISR